MKKMQVSKKQIEHVGIKEADKIENAGIKEADKKYREK